MSRVLADGTQDITKDILGRSQMILGHALSSNLSPWWIALKIYHRRSLAGVNELWFAIIGFENAWRLLTCPCVASQGRKVTPIIPTVRVMCAVEMNKPPCHLHTYCTPHYSWYMESSMRSLEKYPRFRIVSFHTFWQVWTFKNTPNPTHPM